MTDTQNSFWRDAARAGLILGLVIVAFAFLAHYMGLGDSAPGVAGMFNFIATAITIYIYGRQRALKRAGAGFTFGESLLYTLAIILFAGFVVGVGQWIIFTWITPQTYTQAVGETIVRMRELLSSFPQDQVDQFVDTFQRISPTPGYIIFMYIWNMLLFIGLPIGVVAALFVRTERRTGGADKTGQGIA